MSVSEYRGEVLRLTIALSPSNSICISDCLLSKGGDEYRET
jgi:hypothetical protein